MLTTIKGYYEQGQIIMEEEAPVKTKTDVMITFLTGEDEKVEIKKRIPGALKGKVSLPEDFKIGRAHV